MRIELLILMLLTTNCKTTNGNKNQNNHANNASDATGKDSCVQFSKIDPLPKATASQLQVSSISARPGGNLLKATTVEIQSNSQTTPDIFYYEACPFGKTDNCINGNSINGTDTNPFFPSGKYSVYARACVFENRVSEKNDFTAIALPEGLTVYCGSPSNLKTNTNSTTSVDPTSKKAYELEQKKKKLAWQIYSTIKSQQTNSSAQNNDTYAASKQTIIDMGPGIFSEAVNGLLLDFYSASQNSPPPSSESAGCLTLNQLSSTEATLNTQNLQLADTKSGSTNPYPVEDRRAAYALFAVGGALAIVGVTAAGIVHQFRNKYPWKDLLFSVNFQKYSDKLPKFLTKERPVSSLGRAEQAKIAEWQQQIDETGKYKPIAALTGEPIGYLESKPLAEILEEMKKVADGKLAKSTVAYTDPAGDGKTFQELFGESKITYGPPELSPLGQILERQGKLTPEKRAAEMKPKPIFTDTWDTEGFKDTLTSLQEADRKGLLVKSKEGHLQHTATIAAAGPLDKVFKDTSANATSIEKMRRGLMVMENGQVADRFTHTGVTGARAAIGIAAMAAVAGGTFMIASKLELADQVDPITQPTVELIKVLMQQSPQ